MPSRPLPHKLVQVRCRSAAPPAAALGGQAVEFADQVFAGDAALDRPAEASAGVLADDHDLPKHNSRLEIHTTCEY